jgi:hypothetical protein
VVILVWTSLGCSWLRRDWSVGQVELGWIEAACRLEHVFFVLVVWFTDDGVEEEVVVAWRSADVFWWP